MLVDSLKRLADVAEIARLDLAPQPFVLYPQEGAILGWYSGMYAAAAVRVPVDKVELTEPVALGATEFRELISLLEEEEAELKVGKSSLTITTPGGRKISLRFMGDKPTPDLPSLYAKLADLPQHSSINYDAFLREAQIASGIVASTFTIPILTGIRFVFAGERAGVQACNGHSLWYQSTIEATNSKEDRLTVVSPAQDMLLALRILKGGGEAISFAAEGKNLILKTSQALVKLPSLAGEWPPIEAIRKLEFVEDVTIPAASLKSLAAAARAYKADPNVVITPVEEGILLRTQESETGEFEDLIPGTLSRECVFDFTDLEAAAKIADGPVKLSISPPTMALLQSSSRSIYVLMRGSR